MLMRCLRRAVLVCSAMACGYLLACSGAQNPAQMAPKAWWVKDLAMFNNPRVTVTDEEEKPLGRLSTRTLRKLVRAKVGISEASGLHSELVLVEGAQPDALAGFLRSALGRIPAGTPVIVMSLGLVRLLGRDMDAAAYVLGHESAHLLKRHAEASRTVDVRLRRIRVLTETGARRSARPATYAIPFILSGVVERYPQPLEQAAHAAGLRYATGAGFSPAGALRLARLLTGSPGRAVVPFLQRHPQGASGP